MSVLDKGVLSFGSWVMMVVVIMWKHTEAVQYSNSSEPLVVSPQKDVWTSLTNLQTDTQVD